MKLYKDKCLLYLTPLIEAVRREHERQVRKWGIQQRDAFEWLAYTIEELGELANAISDHMYRQGPVERVIAEAIQVATLCLKIAEMFHYEAGDGE